MEYELDRAKVVDRNFTVRVKDHDLPLSTIDLNPQQVGLNKDSVLELFESQIISRHLDLQARVLKDKQQGFYTIGSSGHEGNAAIAKAFHVTDMAFLHYRSGAFMVQRAQAVPEVDPIEAILLSLVASSDDPVSAGRHKVLGSVPLWLPPQTSTIASHLPKAVGAALSITRAKELKIKSPLSEDSCILCSFGDASINHSTAQGAFNAAQWIAHGHYPLPLVFICEDNGLGISVKTPDDWVEQSFSQRENIHYLKADGLNILDTYKMAKEAAHIARDKKQPVFLHVKTVRLLGHAGSDIEHQYRDVTDIEMTEAEDPLLHSAKIILDNQYASAQEIIENYEHWRDKVAAMAKKVVLRPKLNNAKAVKAAIIPPTGSLTPLKYASEAQRKACFAELYPQLKLKRNLCQNINFALMDILLAYDNIVVFGEDVGKKGGVYRVTAGLQQRFSQRRVFDTLLDEQSILGTAMGMAHNGFLPIPEIQFLAYLHNAEDQLRGEAATLSFFSNGQYTDPMVLRIASFAYQKGFGGHFHNDNSIAILRDIPGIIIACPSNGCDAVKMLRSCVQLAQQQRRIVVFLEPIALYMMKDLHQTGDNGWLFQYPNLHESIELGEIQVEGDSEDVAIISYGNGYYLTRQAAKILEDKHQIQVKTIDLRWLAPLNEQALLAAVKQVKNVVIVDECRKTGSLSEALMTLFMEKLIPLPTLKRITGDDSFIPIGSAWQYVLPSNEDIVATVIDMLS